jgi:cytoskeletal protein CcmA (bactofilin family)
MEEARTIIADDVEISGSLKSSAGVKMAGKLNGDLTCGGDVLVEKGAAVKGNVTANSVVVLGMIKGNIIAKERIELKGAARVAGDIKAKRLTVEEGVTLAGKAEIVPGESASLDAATEAESQPAAEEAAKPEEESVRGGQFQRPQTDPRTRTGQLFARK